MKTRIVSSSTTSSTEHTKSRNSYDTAWKFNVANGNVSDQELKKIPKSTAHSLKKRTRIPFVTSTGFGLTGWSRIFKEKLTPFPSAWKTLLPFEKVSSLLQKSNYVFFKSNLFRKR